MNYTTVKNPKWANAAHTMINCEVDFDDLVEEFVPFSAVPSGDYEHSHEIFARCAAGEFGEVAPYTPPPDITGEEALSWVRDKRNDILRNVVDPVVTNPLRWADLSAEKQAAWVEYRRALLDITTNFPSPIYSWDETIRTYQEQQIQWPEKPI